jgi:hypothetical protein
MMKIKAHSLIVGLALLAILPVTQLVTPSSAQSPAKSLKDELVGHWQLTAVTVNSRTPYGANPQGSMFLDAGGNFSVIVISSGDARSISYFGTYTVNDAAKSMTMHIVGSGGGSGIDVSGRDVTRLIGLNGDNLTIQNQTPRGPGGVTLTWKKAN